MPKVNARVTRKWIKDLRRKGLKDSEIVTKALSASETILVDDRITIIQDLQLAGLMPED